MSSTERHIVTTAVDCPWTSALLLVLGSVSLGQFLLKTIYAFAQTFLLSGTSVSCENMPTAVLSHTARYS